MVGPWSGVFRSALRRFLDISFFTQSTRFLPVFTFYTPACRSVRLQVSHIHFKMDSLKEVNMSKRRKNAAMPEALWIVAYIDHMTRSDSFDSEAMPREQAKARYAELTENGTRETSKNKSALGYYELRQQRRVQ